MARGGGHALARSLFADGLAHTALAVPIEQQRAFMHLDTVCTMVDTDAVVMYPNIRDTMSAFTLVHDAATDAVRITGERPFVDAAAEAMGISKLRVIDTGLDPVTVKTFLAFGMLLNAGAALDVGVAHLRQVDDDGDAVAEVLGDHLRVAILPDVEHGDVCEIAEAVSPVQTHAGAGRHRADAQRLMFVERLECGCSTSAKQRRNHVDVDAEAG